MQKIIIPLLAALLLLPACSAAERQHKASAAVSEPGTAAESDAPEGSYYNHELKMLLTLDSSGECRLSGADTKAAGTYTAAPGSLTLDFGTRQEIAHLDEDGGIRIEGSAGVFLRGAAPADGSTYFPGSGTEIIPSADGSFRCRDYDACIACTCARGMELLPGLLSGALAVTDGANGYVSGRNVTDALTGFSGAAENFLETYIRTYTFADFDVFYGDLTHCSDPAITSGGEDGRLTSASLLISDDAHEIAVSVILYTASYADGTINYICKSCFAPAAAPDDLDALAEAVTGMSAVRMIPQDAAA